MSFDKLHGRINLDRATALVLDGNQQSSELLAQILNGFGLRRLRRCTSAKDAEQALSTSEIDLAFVDTMLSEQSGFDWVQQFRHEAPEPHRFVPVIMLAGHTGMSHVEKARDCGANFIVAKPVAPPILLDRIMWVARSDRTFVYTDSYAGPDRRFKFEGPPPGIRGRRSTDLSGKVGASDEPNLSQSDIDKLLQPRRASV